MARTNAGLAPETDIKADTKLTTKFIDNPRFKTKAEMDRLRKQEMLQDLHNKKNYQHQSNIKRINEREQAYATSTDKDG
jgi:hypothetical protein